MQPRPNHNKLHNKTPGIMVTTNYHCLTLTTNSLSYNLYLCESDVHNTCKHMELLATPSWPPRFSLSPVASQNTKLPSYHSEKEVPLLSVRGTCPITSPSFTNGDSKTIILVFIRATPCRSNMRRMFLYTCFMRWTWLLGMSWRWNEVEVIKCANNNPSQSSRKIAEVFNCGRMQIQGIISDHEANAPASWNCHRVETSLATSVKLCTNITV